MKTIILTLVFSACLWAGAENDVVAQTIYYHYKFSYDDDGNREQRFYIGQQLKSATIEGPIAFDQDKAIVDKIGFDQVKIYPNPTNGNLVVEIPELKNENARIRVFSLQGKQLIDNTALPNSRSFIDLTHFSSGMYIMKIYIGSECSDWKIIKE